MVGTAKVGYAVVALFILILTANGSAVTLQEEALSALELAAKYFRTTLSCRGGYLWKYSEDLEEWWGEGKATPSQIWVQPPGTPTVGLTFLAAYEVTGDERYLEAARAAADALIWGQLAPGGWDYKIDFLNEAGWRYRHEGPHDTTGSLWCTFDDDVSQSATRLLMAVDAVLKQEPYSEAARCALDFIIESQFDNGAWPQWYPLRGGYHDMYTFNDGAINDCIKVMIEAYTRYGDERYLRSAQRGGDFIIASQIEEPQPGWAQQYHWNMSPGWARSFEPPAVCSSVTARNIDTLLDLYLLTGNETYLEPVPRAVRWLNESKIGYDLWARFYELGTNRPLYCDRDYKLTYNLSELSEERRLGYSWQGNYAVGSIRRYIEVVSKGRERYLQDRQRQLTEEEKAQKASGLEATVERVASGLDPQGRWVEDGWVYCETFNRNVGYLAAYLRYSGYNDTAPLIPRMEGFSFDVSEDGVLARVRLQHPLGLNLIASAAVRFDPGIPPAQFPLSDGGTEPDLERGDGIYSGAIDVPKWISTGQEGLLVIQDVDGHWNVARLPLGQVAKVVSLMQQIANLSTEAGQLGADITTLLERFNQLKLAAKDVKSQPELLEIVSLAETLATDLEKAAIERRIEVASALIAAAKAQGLDTSRHEVFLGIARDEFAKGNYARARMYTEYPLRLSEVVAEPGLAFVLAVVVALVHLQGLKVWTQA